jgi:hypothetical protein
MDPIPPVIDVERQLRIEGEPRPIFHIIACVIVILFVFFLIKRYRDKRATERAHSL